MKNDTDMALLRMSLDGDARAFEKLIDRHYLMVYRVSYKWCRVKEDAEDVTQDVFVKLANKLKTFNSKSSFKTWIYRITINTAKDFVRKHATKSRYETVLTSEEHWNAPPSAPEEQLLATRIFAEIDKLPEKQKAAVLLVCGEGLSHREAASILNCSETTVSWRIFQARKKLKKSLQVEI
jgi:RNA polymerase sigma-70 factor (ECF subfamily)